MRTDCKIDGKRILCRNVSILGSDLGYFAVPGNMVLYHYGDGATRIGRVIGRVSAPALGEQEEIKGYALVLELAHGAEFCYERWINPDDITRIFNAPSEFAAWFFQEHLPYDAKTLRRLSEYGTLCERYISKTPSRVKAWKEEESS